MPEFYPRILSGVQPAARGLHLGHYFGAIQNHIALEHEYPGEAFYFIADYHALTTTHDATALATRVQRLAGDYLALGLDPAKASLYRQSDVPQVCELMWILSCVFGKGQLDRGHALKDAVAHGKVPSVGLYLYPLLMAADILAVRATVIPVGADQSQGVEIAREVARSFNSRFQADIFPEPELRIAPLGTVPGIDGRKMATAYDNAIYVFPHDEEELEAQINAIVTDSTPLGVRQAVAAGPLFDLLELFAGPRAAADIRSQVEDGAMGYREAKSLLLADARSLLKPVWAARQDVSDEIIEDVLRDGGERARVQAEETLEEVREVIGLGYRRLV